MDTQLRYPTLLRHTIDAYQSKGFANITATYCVPLAPGRSRVFVRQPFRFKAKIPEFIMSAPCFRPAAVVCTLSHTCMNRDLAATASAC